MIPKIIHYCWFGRNPLPPLAKKCLKSWEKKCPDFEIIEWNEDNFDFSTAPLYVRQAYEEKKWAFVSDYVRLYVLTTFGGIYMDTDVEVIRPLTPFLVHKAFSGFEDEANVPTGIMACEKGFPLFIEFLRYYDDADFYDQEGEMKLLTTNVVIITEICLRHGLVQNNTYQVIDDFALYPKDYFCPVSYKSRELEKTANTVTIHWFSGSWQTAEMRALHIKQIEMDRRVRRANQFHKIIKTPNRVLNRLIGEVRYEKLKAKLKRKQ